RAAARVGSSSRSLPAICSRVACAVSCSPIPKYPRRNSSTARYGTIFPCAAPYAASTAIPRARQRWQICRARVRGVLLADREVPAQELQHREVRDHLPVRRTVRRVDRDPARAAALAELVAEAALADARLGHDAHDLGVARRRPCPRGLPGR